MPCWLLIVLAVLIIIFIFNVPESSAEWAAWVQALGTILAIGSGFALHFWKARAAELRTLLQIERALNQVTEELNRSIDDADENGEVGINYSNLRQLAVFLDHKANDIDLGFAVITAVADLSHIVRETYDRMEAAKLGGELRPLRSEEHT